ncbi:hypothetical protein V8F33_013964, partial [Rhypophila sp. PSN 637]
STLGLVCSLGSGRVGGYWVWGYWGLVLVYFRSGSAVGCRSVLDLGFADSVDVVLYGRSTLFRDVCRPANQRTIRRELARLILLYPLAYAIVWSLPICIRIYQTITGHPAPWQLQTIDEAYAIIYGAIESSLSNWRSLFFLRKFLPPSMIMGVGDTGTSTAGTGKRASKRWTRSSMTAPPRSGDQQLVTTPNDSLRGSSEVDLTQRMGSSCSGASTLGNDTHKTDVGCSSGLTEGIELGAIESTKAARSGETSMGIRKTVDIQVVSSSIAGARVDQANGTRAVVKPLRAYFPENRELRGTFMGL